MSIRQRIRSSIARRQAAEHTGVAEALRDTWSRYPKEWKQDPRLNLGFTTLGDEWGGPEFADFIVELVARHLGPDVDVLELGCGGGKFSERLAPRCRSLVCTDISQQMLTHARQSLAERGVGGNVEYLLLNGVDFEGVETSSVDLIFSYDVQLHLQPQNVFSYMLDARRVLRDDGIFMLHQINLDSDGGMSHFLIQFGAGTWKHGFEDPRRRGHIYFMSEDQLRALAGQAGLSVERIVSDQEEFNAVTAGRDLIGFLRKRRSRLDVSDRDSLRLIKLEGQGTVYALIDGRRLSFTSAHQFERAGFRWEQIEQVTAAELAATLDGGPLEVWE